MSEIQLPPSCELFERDALIARHPSILNRYRVEWALRRRHKNGLDAVGAVFESRAGVLLIHEPTFIRWLLGLTGRARPRARRRTRGNSVS